jgi:hypothetical protein
MSSASPFNTDPVAFDTLNRVFKPAQFLGFWMAVVTPFVVLGLVTAGNAVQHSPLILTGLLLLNVVGIILGRDYHT